MQQPDRRQVLGAMGMIAGAGILVASLPVPMVDAIGSKAEGEATPAPLRYVFASDPRVVEPGYKLLPG